MTPRSDGAARRRAAGDIDQFALANPHPEVSWRTLFGKVWYEGYAAARVRLAVDRRAPTTSSRSSAWCRSIFGTIKGTFYALLFAIPLAVLGALYTSQFVHPSIRARDQADGRDHGGAAERRHRLPRRAVSGAGRRAQSRRRAADAGRCCRCSARRAFCSGGWLPAAFAQRLQARHGAAADPAAAARWRGWVALRSRPTVEALLFARRRAAVAARRRSASPTTSATASSSAWRWASPSFRSSSRSPRTRSRACRRA